MNAGPMRTVPTNLEPQSATPREVLRTRRLTAAGCVSAANGCGLTPSGVAGGFTPSGSGGVADRPTVSGGVAAISDRADVLFYTDADDTLIAWRQYNTEADEARLEKTNEALRRHSAQLVSGVSTSRGLIETQRLAHLMRGFPMAFLGLNNGQQLFINHRGRPAEEPEDPPRRLVSSHRVPFPVDDDRGIGLLPLEDELERAADVLELGRFEVALAVRRSVAGGQEHGVALAERDVEHAGEELDHLAAGVRAPGLEEGQVAGRDLGLDREHELAHPAGQPPVPEQGSEGRVHRPSHATPVYGMAAASQ